MIMITDLAPVSGAEAEQELPPGLESLPGESPALRTAVEEARRAAAGGGAGVLVLGETGTGKELFARGIHHAGPAAGAPFIAVDCAAIPAPLLESELFGYEAGAFEGVTEGRPGLAELAGRGTLYLKEVGELSASIQHRLLDLLDGKVHRVGGGPLRRVACHVIAGSNRSLEELVALGRFNPELLRRLGEQRVSVPALRDRGRDVELLALNFLARSAGDDEARVLTGDAVEVLYRHRWPGNVRELKHTLERACLMTANGVIDARHLTIQVRWNRPALAEGLEGAWDTGDSIRIPPEGKALEEIEAEAVQATLDITRGNQSAAARILGISRPTLSRKIRRYGLRVRRARRP